MGIPFLRRFLQEHYPDIFRTVYPNYNVADMKIDNLCIDMNGIFHQACQKVFKYGMHKPLPNLRRNPRAGYVSRDPKVRQQQANEEVCNIIEHLVEVVQPQKRIILCVDGAAGSAKSAQQRQRRYRSAKERDPQQLFDSNCLSPGTIFMHNLTKYIDWFIRKKMTTDGFWRKIEVVYSNEKHAGEGEHKIILLAKKLYHLNQSWCIHGLDADLVMLALATHIDKMYLLQDDLRLSEGHHNLVDIGLLSKHLKDELKFEKSRPESIINDFVFMCYLVGNDFLPHSPSLEILDGAIEVLFEAYQRIAPEHGHLTDKIDGKIFFNTKTFAPLISLLAENEQKLIEKRLNDGDNRFDDELLAKFVSGEHRKRKLDYDGFRQAYYREKFPETSPEQVAMDFLEGMQWVLTYYTTGIPSWTWLYPHHYAPFNHELALALKKYTHKAYPKSTPLVPFQQLLSVLPPQSANLLPQSLAKIMTDLPSEYPDDFKVDFAGKRFSWQGIALLPILDLNLILEKYQQYIEDISELEKIRNIPSNILTYNFNPKIRFMFKSYYGEFECKVECKPLV